MLSKLLKILKKGFRGLGQKGYTLIEVAAVVAVTATLAAVVVPVATQKIKEGKQDAAMQDCKTIATAISSFYADTGVWPARNQGTAYYFQILKSGDENTLAVTWDTGVQDTWAGTSAREDYLENHLVVDNPGGGNPGDTLNTDYHDNKINWNGPYIERARRTDPWGHPYLVYVEALHTSKEYSGMPAMGWVISAGADGKVETKTSDALPQGDDIGVIIDRKRS